MRNLTPEECEQVRARVLKETEDIIARENSLAPCRWPMIVSDDHAYGMARMWGIMTEKTKLEILPFRTAEEATEWLGVDKSFVPLRFVSASREMVRVAA